MNLVFNKRIARRFCKGQPDQNWVVLVERGGMPIVAKHGTHEACKAWAKSARGYEGMLRLERRNAR